MAEQIPASTKCTGNKVKGSQRAKNIKNITKVSNNYYPPPEARQVPRKGDIRMILSPTRSFVGRDDILKNVRHYFDSLPLEQSDCWSRIVAFVGLGGIGKTELAHKFAANSKDKFPCVASINAETEESLQHSFRQLARRLDIVPWDGREVDVDFVRRIYDHIAKDYTDVLLVFDNAIRLQTNDDQFGIFDYLPCFDVYKQRFPHILITSQTQDWSTEIKQFHVDALDERDSKHFFQKCFKTKPAEMNYLYKKLHQNLQGYPLAMTLAASNIIEGNKRDDSVKELKRQIRLYLKGLDEEDGMIVNEKRKNWPTYYNKTLRAAFDPTIKRLKKATHGAQALEFLQILSFMKLLHTYYVDKIFVFGTERLRYPEIPFLEQVIDVLDRFFTVKKFKERKLNSQRTPKSVDNDNIFRCSLRIHKIVQLVVCKTTDCTASLEGVLCNFTRKHGRYHHRYIVNLLELNRVRQKCQLSKQVLPYIGIRASDGKRVNFKQARLHLNSIMEIPN